MDPLTHRPTLASVLVATMLLAGAAPAAAEGEAPELRVVAIGYTGYSAGGPVAGDNITFQATIRNTGNASSGTFTVAYFVDDVFVGYDDLSLAAGQDGPVQQSWIATTGSHTVTLRVDHHDTVAETDETNNAVSFLVGVTPYPTPDGRPDILILDAGPAGPAEPGQAVVLRALVANYGGGDGGFHQAEISVDGQRIHWDHFATPRGATREVSTVWTATPGPHNVSVVVDRWGSVNESNELNNTYAWSIDVPQGNASLPELRVGITATPFSPVEGQVVVVEAFVENTGNATSGGSTMAIEHHGNTTRFSIGPLAPGEWTTRNLTWTATPGDHTFGAAADVFGNVSEEHEDNNVANLTLHVEGNATRPDLVPNVTIPSVAPPGGNVTIRASVRNAGNATAGPSITRVSVGGDLLCECATGPIAPGGNMTFFLPWTARAGNHTATVVADAFGNVSESREDNNVASRPIQVANASVDLKARLSYVPDETPQGAWMYFEAEVTNAGAGVANGVVAHLAVDGILVESYTLTLGPGDTAWLSGWWNATHVGYHGAAVIVDPYGSIAETNESNNRDLRTFRVLPVGDVGIEILGVEHEPLTTDVGTAPNPLGRHTVHVALTNHGDDWVVAVADLSANATTRRAVVPTGSHVGSEWSALAPGETRILSFEWDPTALGDVQLEARVWLANAIDRNAGNDRDTHDDFVLVGGLGGVVLA